MTPTSSPQPTSLTTLWPYLFPILLRIGGWDDHLWKKSTDYRSKLRSPHKSNGLFIYLFQELLLPNNNNDRFTALCPGLPGWASTRRNTHPPTILMIIQSLSASSIYHDPQHPPCSNYVLGNLFAQPLSMSSFVYLLVWRPPPHIPYISSSNQRLLFAAHAHTIAACFAVVSILYHLKFQEISFTIFDDLLDCCEGNKLQLVTLLW